MVFDIEVKTSRLPAIEGRRRIHLSLALLELRAFCTRCRWKGESCSDGAIWPRETDMGVCYTFYNEDDMFIEQSGEAGGG